MSSKSAEYREETTELGDKKVADEIAAEISSSWKFKGHPPKIPVLLFMSGFQGSGKTTVIDVLKQDLDLAVVSSDEIRYKLFERRWENDEKFRQTVNVARNALLRKALETGYNITIDQFVTKERVEVAERIVRESGKGYKLLFIYLDAPEEVLIDRVKKREPVPGKYNGTVEELMADFQKRGYPNYGMFDRVIDSSNKTPQQLSDQIKPLLI